MTALSIYRKRTGCIRVRPYLCATDFLDRSEGIQREASTFTAPTSIHTAGDHRRGEGKPSACTTHLKVQLKPQSETASADTTEPVGIVSAPAARQPLEHREYSRRAHEGQSQQGGKNSTRNDERCSTNTSGGVPSTSVTGFNCWDSDAILQAYRVAAARTVRRLSSALFGHKLLAVEAARTSAAQREKMLEGRAQALLESQVIADKPTEKQNPFVACGMSMWMGKGASPSKSMVDLSRRDTPHLIQTRWCLRSSSIDVDV